MTTDFNNEKSRKFLERILLSEDVVKSLKNNMDFIRTIIPTIKDMHDFRYGKPAWYNYPAWEHTLQALSISQRDLDIRLTLLFSGIAKPYCKCTNGVDDYGSVPKDSATMARAILTKLGYDNDYVTHICNFISNQRSTITNELINKYYSYCVKLYEIETCDVAVSSDARKEEKKEYLEYIKSRLDRKKLDSNPQQTVNYSYYW